MGAAFEIHGFMTLRAANQQERGEAAARCATLMHVSEPHSIGDGAMDSSAGRYYSASYRMGIGQNGGPAGLRLRCSLQASSREVDDCRIGLFTKQFSTCYLDTLFDFLLLRICCMVFHKHGCHTVAVSRCAPLSLSVSPPLHLHGFRDSAWHGVCETTCVFLGNFP